MVWAIIDDMHNNSRSENTLSSILIYAVISEQSRQLLRDLWTVQLLRDFRCLLVVYNIGNDFIIKVYPRMLMTTIGKAETGYRTLFTQPSHHNHDCPTYARWSYCAVKQCHPSTYNRDFESRGWQKWKHRWRNGMSLSNCWDALKWWGLSLHQINVWIHTHQNLMNFWIMVLGSKSSKWNVGKRWKTSPSVKYLFFIILCVSKHGK